MSAKAGYKTLQQLANAYKIDPRTLKAYIIEKMPIEAAFFYGSKPKRLYSPAEIQLITRQLGTLEYID